MLKFALDRVFPATFENLNCRTEKSGEDKVPAADLKISCPLPAAILDLFRPGLKEALFEPGPKDLFGEAGLKVRDPHITYPISRDEEMTGAEVAIDFGIGDPMRFTDAKINQFRITPNDGGSVIVGFRVQCRPSEEQAGKLYVLQEKGITISVKPAEEPKMAEAA